MEPVVCPLPLNTCQSHPPLASDLSSICRLQHLVHHLGRMKYNTHQEIYVPTQTIRVSLILFPQVSILSSYLKVFTFMELCPERHTAFNTLKTENKNLLRYPWTSHFSRIFYFLQNKGGVPRVSWNFDIQESSFPCR